MEAGVTSCDGASPIACELANVALLERGVGIGLAAKVMGDKSGVLEELLLEQAGVLLCARAMARSR